MKTIEETITETVNKTITKYACEESGCQFTATSLYDAKNHMASKHSFLKRTVIDYQEFLFFDSKEKLDWWAKNQNNVDRNDTKDAYVGPGWYCPETWADTYDDCHLILLHINKVIDKCKEEIVKLANNIEKYEALKGDKQ